MLDSDEWNTLEYVPITEINGVACGQLEIADACEEIEYWKSSVLCSVLGENPPFEIIKGYIKRIWANYKIDQIIQVRKGLFLVRFIHLQDKLVVEKRGFYYFDNKPFV